MLLSPTLLDTCSTRPAHDASRVALCFDVCLASDVCHRTPSMQQLEPVTTARRSFRLNSHTLSINSKTRLKAPSAGRWC